MIWIVNTNSTICRIYEYVKKPASLILVKELLHPESRLKASEVLTSDKPGHYATPGHAHGAFEPHTDPKAVEVDKFSREIAKELDRGRTQGNYEKLILITPSHMEGILNQHLNKHVAERMTNRLQKDLLHLPEHELLHYIQTNAAFPD